MERRKPFRKSNPRPNKNYRRIFIEKSEVRKKADELMMEYRMPEGTALQIALGILPLSVWETKRQEEQKIQKIWKEIDESIQNFSNQAILKLETAIQILKGAFSLKEYREQKISKMELQSRAENFAHQENIPVHIAKMILLGKFSLIEYQKRQEEKLSRQEKANAIRIQYPNIAIGTCYKIVDEGIPVEEYLERREHNQERRKEWYRNYLQEHQQENQPLAEYLQRLRNRRVLMFFSFFNQKTMIGTIIGHTPYEIRVRDAENKTHVCPKLNMKFICRVNYTEQVLSLLEINRELQGSPKIPSPNPYDRYVPPPELLQAGQRLKILLREGEILIGNVQWASKYDIKLILSESPKTTVLVFRHAIDSMQMVESIEQFVVCPKETTETEGGIQ